MTSFLTATLNLTDPNYEFTGSIGTTFDGAVYEQISTANWFPATFTIQSSTLATAAPVELEGFTLLPGGTYQFTIAFGSNNGSPFLPFTNIPNNNTIIDPASTQFGTITFEFSTFPGEGMTGGLVGDTPIGGEGGGDPQIGAAITVTFSCLHGSSLIQMRDGEKRIDQIKSGDEVLSGSKLDEYVKVKALVHCWLTYAGTDHDAVIIEQGAIAENLPSSRLIIDPGHPMCTKESYLENGFQELRPAGTYWEELKGDKVFTKPWTDVLVQNEPSRRYDLILEEPFNTYVANGLVVQAKGYRHHGYKQLV